jgi:hypothetical protein
VRATRVLRGGTVLLAVAAVLGASACGRIGPPRPPEYVIPMSPEPVKVENTPEGTKISWKRPKEYVGGDALDDLAGFRVQRVCLPDASFSVIATVPVEDQQRFRKTPTFSTVDRDAPIGLQCRYQVIAFTFDEYTSPPAESEDFIRSFPGAMP